MLMLISDVFSEILDLKLHKTKTKECSEQKF